MNVKTLHAYYKADGSYLPDELKPYQDEYLLLQHRILTRRWLRHTDQSSRFTLLKRAIIEEELTKPIAAKLLRWGKDSGVFLCDGSYIEDKKSFGYRLREDLEALPTHRTPLTNPKLVERIKSYQKRDSRHLTKAHRHLKRWHDQVSISCGALRTAEEYSTTPEQLEANRGAIEMLMDREFTFGVCDYGRAHTNITRLFRPIRKHLLLEGSSLVNIDVANSQPLFLGIALLASGYCHPNPASGFPPPIRSLNGHFQIHNPLKEQTDTTDFKKPQTASEIDDINDYISTCSSGTLYAEIMQGIGWEFGKDRFKSEAWFAFLYGSNKDDNKLAAPEKKSLRDLNRYFENRFPNVYGWMWEKKRQNYRRLSWEMQRAESTVMIDGVAARLADDHPDIPVLTIHDSFLTTPKHVETVKGLIYEQFAQLGVRPTLGIEDYADKHTKESDEEYPVQCIEDEDRRRR